VQCNMAGVGLRWQCKAWRQVTQGFASVGFAAMGQSKKRGAAPT